jgi:sugar-phosphatase
VRAVLFDVDGVVLDSYAGYRSVWSRWCALRGVDLELAWAATHGRRPTETVAEVAAHLDPQDEYLVLKALLAEAGDVFPAYEAAPALLSALPASGWGVVTSGQRETVLARFEASCIPAPAVLVDGDDVTSGKPSPEGYLKAALLIGAAPEDCLVVEDAPAGVAAGKAAGMTVLALSTTHVRQELSNDQNLWMALGEVTRRGAPSRG